MAVPADDAHKPNKKEGESVYESEEDDSNDQNEQVNSDSGDEDQIVDTRKARHGKLSKCLFGGIYQLKNPLVL